MLTFSLNSHSKLRYTTGPLQISCHMSTQCWDAENHQIRITSPHATWNINMASSRGIGNTLVHKTRLGLCIKYLVSAAHPCVIGAINVISSNNNINLGQPQQKTCNNPQPTTSTNLNKKNLQHPTIAKLKGLKLSGKIYLKSWTIWDKLRYNFWIVPES